MANEDASSYEYYINKVIYVEGPWDLHHNEMKVVYTELALMLSDLLQLYSFKKNKKLMKEIVPKITRFRELYTQEYKRLNALISN